MNHILSYSTGLAEYMRYVPHAWAVEDVSVDMSSAGVWNITLTPFNCYSNFNPITVNNQNVSINVIEKTVFSSRVLATSANFHSVTSISKPFV